MNKIKLALIGITLVAGSTVLLTHNKIALSVGVIGAAGILVTEVKTFKEVLGMISFK